MWGGNSQRNWFSSREKSVISVKVGILGHLRVDELYSSYPSEHAFIPGSLRCLIKSLILMIDLKLWRKICRTQPSLLQASSRTEEIAGKACLIVHINSDPLEHLWIGCFGNIWVWKGQGGRGQAAPTTTTATWSGEKKIVVCMHQILSKQPPQWIVITIQSLLRFLSTSKTRENSLWSGSFHPKET